jgi:predicted nucleic-acid-binding protein
MRYLDANVLVRLITGDDRALAEQAIETIEGGSQGEFEIIDAILVELCFILEFHPYKMEREDITNAIEALADTPQVTVSDQTRAALRLYRKHSKLDYADCLLTVLGGKQGVVTFDKDLQKELLLQEQPQQTGQTVH